MVIKIDQSVVKPEKSPDIKLVISYDENLKINT